ncbi:GDSL-type esterase/lipase family protein [Rathayibacter rathayi]|uniref:golvesin C-terminal-like domain-containing protein n=1 Tax=Rathayibacter rathayi TaxID=33887 RepID=UPI000FD7F7ED|nr:GDSL-type esterase/lipase family protein [Rathayibacter rathayi]MWV75544.1 NocE [Rathayibacter rathayi NCPPB 2980 = VKM Ac-1601]
MNQFEKEMPMRTRILSSRRPSTALAVIALWLLLAASLPSVSYAQQTSFEAPANVPGAEIDPSAAANASLSVPEEQRSSLLGNDWAASKDLIAVAAGSDLGFSVLAAKASDGYSWQSVAMLTVPGVETSQWIGNTCTTGDGSKLVAVYAPREVTNSEYGYSEGAYAAVVDLRTGKVTDLGSGYSIAYFNPGCGVGDSIVLTSYTSPGQTTLTVVDANSDEQSTVKVDGVVTSATKDQGGIVAASTNSLLRVAPDGTISQIASTEGISYDLVPTKKGVAFLETDGITARAKEIEPALEAPAADPVAIASAPLTELGLTRDGAGEVYVLGDADADTPEGISVVDVPAAARISATGELAITEVKPALVASENAPVEPGLPHTAVEILGTSLVTDKDVTFLLDPETTAAGLSADSDVAPSAADDAVTSGMGAGGAGGRLGMARSAPLRLADPSPTNPVESERACSVPRNDPGNQAYQPKPRQVEWAVDMAVKGLLTNDRPANWQGQNLGVYAPQKIFPKPTLDGGGEIPAQIVLGVLTQESNLWQASRYTTPGETGNPLIGNFYGNSRTADGPAFWSTNFLAAADCGYGVSQITDRMRLSGMPRPGDTDDAFDYQTQRRIALDYQVNIALAVKMLTEKWNQTRARNMSINNGDPSKIENWFFATWAYNSGLHAPGEAGTNGAWGVGWLNNPANPLYDPARQAFLDTSAADAAKPQNWPYPEKVMGFAAYSIELSDSATTTVMGYRTASWNANDDAEGTINRRKVKPPIFTFCSVAANSCDPTKKVQPADGSEKAGPCLHKDASGSYDLRCWYHQSAKWKSDCATTCGVGFIRFDPGYAAEPDSRAFPVACRDGVGKMSGLPADALLIDDVPSNATPSRSDCAAKASNGSFAFSFFRSSLGQYPGKIDLHQLGTGANGHFYFAHTRPASNAMTNPSGTATINGTWTLDHSLSQWGRVLVHMPDHGAWTQQAEYTIDLGNGTKKTRVALQRNYANTWISLGVFSFAGTPKVSLSNVSHDGDGVDDVAWDAIAIQPLAAKPRDIVVSMGDSFSSGEGASDLNGAQYYRATDNNGTPSNPGVGKINEETKNNRYRNACHRSTESWSRKAILDTNTSATIATRADTYAADMDYHFIACSGAESEHLLPYYSVSGTKPINGFSQNGVLGRFRELAQLDQGYVDENTTLVTLSIGGNDARFAKILQTCVTNFLPHACQSLKIDNDAKTLPAATADLINTNVKNSVITVLRQIRLKAPGAKILLMGYPMLFEKDTQCVGINETEKGWLNDTSTLLNARLKEAAVVVSTAAAPVVFGDPMAAFQGRNLCVGATSAINGLVFDQTPGDDPMWVIPKPGTDVPLGVSQQAVHPNKAGTTLYAQVMMTALRGVYK